MTVLIFGILALSILFQALQWPLSPRFLDWYYHLSVVEGFRQAGGYAAWAFWENAPVGRPHLYPPVLHLLMYGLRAVGFEPITVARIFCAALFPLTLWVQHKVARELFGKRVALWVTALYASSYPLYLSSTALPAFTLAYLWGLMALLWTSRGRPVMAALGLTLCFYTHSLAPWLFAGALLGSGRKSALGTIGLALLATAPLLWHQFSYRSFFRVPDVNENLFWEIDPLLTLLGLAGAILCLRKKGYERFWLFWSLSLIPAAFFYRARVADEHLLIGWVWLGAFALEKLWTKVSGRRVLTGVLIATLAWVGPTVRIDGGSRTFRLDWNDRTLAHLLDPASEAHLRGKELRTWAPQHYEPVVRLVREHSSSQDIVWSNWNYAGGWVALLAGRRTSTAMLAEVAPARPFDQMSAAKLLIFFKDPDWVQKGWIEREVQRRRLKFVGETDFALVYENP